MLKMDDFVGAGFHRLPDNLIEQHPPEVKWGEKVRMMSAKGRERYLTRVAATMNHAAALLQRDKDTLNTVAIQMKEQLDAMASAMKGNNSMLAFEITRLNEDRQQMLKTIARQNAELRARDAEIAELKDLTDHLHARVV